MFRIFYKQIHSFHCLVTLQRAEFLCINIYKTRAVTSIEPWISYWQPAFVCLPPNDFIVHNRALVLSLYSKIEMLKIASGITLKLVLQFSWNQNSGWSTSTMANRMVDWLAAVFVSVQICWGFWSCLAHIADTSSAVSFSRVCEGGRWLCRSLENRVGGERSRQDSYASLLSALKWQLLLL